MRQGREIRTRRCGKPLTGTLNWLPIFLFICSCAPQLPKVNTAINAQGYLPGQNFPSAAVPKDWWRIFGNDDLNALVQAGLNANPTIAMAQQTLIAARENENAAMGTYLPQVELNAPGNSLVSRQSYPTGPNGYPPYTQYSLTGTISYDPGFFGARKYTYENGKALADYQTDEMEAARQNIATGIVTTCISIAGAQQQIGIVSGILTTEQKLLQVLQGQYAEGAISESSIFQQQSTILTTEAELPVLQTELTSQRDQLAILVGQLPVNFEAPKLPLDRFVMPQTVPVEIPSTLLENRPDIQAALALVDAQNAALGIAVAQLYPDFSFSATGGYAAETTSALFSASSALWILAGNLLAPIYEGGQLHARKRAAQAQLAAALYQYRATVLAAFAQVGSQLQAVQDDRIILDRARSAGQAADAAYQRGAAQFQMGAIGYTTILSVQNDAAEAARQIGTAQADLLKDIAELESGMAPST